MSITQYVGRSYDVSLFYNARAEGRTAVSFALFGDQPTQITTGIQQLAQRFVLHLLTERGSIATQPTIGSGLLIRIASGYIRSAADAKVAFYFAADEIEDAMLEEETADMQPDQRFARVELVSATLSGNNVLYNTRLYSRSGTSRELILPLNVTVN